MAFYPTSLQEGSLRRFVTFKGTPYNDRSTTERSPRSRHAIPQMALREKRTVTLHVSSTHNSFSNDDGEQHSDDSSNTPEHEKPSTSPLMGQGVAALCALGTMWLLHSTQLHHHLHTSPLTSTSAASSTSTMFSALAVPAGTTPLSLLQLAQSAWMSYQRVLNSNPVATKAATSAFVYALGDMIAQSSESSSSSLSLDGMAENDDGIVRDDLQDQRVPLDLSRILKSLIAGGVGHGPLSHVWYNLSESFFQNWHWASSMAGGGDGTTTAAWWGLVIPKIIADQAVWGPIWTSLYLLMLGMMNGQSPRAIQETIRTSLIPLTVQGLALWPAAHVITYGLVPVQDRLLWVDLVEIVWVTILATQAQSSMQEQQQHQQQLLPPSIYGLEEESSSSSPTILPITENPK